MDAIDSDLPQVIDTPSDARALRIAAAVERSKKEYQAEHATTEREWFVNSESGPSKDKKDRQRLEYVATHRLLFPPSANASSSSSNSSTPASLVADILACGKLTNLSRELLATGIQAAIQAGDADSALLFARASKTQWRSYPGLAVLASQAFGFAGETKEATQPLLMSTGSALHYPVLEALAGTLRCAGEEELSRILRNLAESRQWAFTGDIFSEGREARGGAPTVQGMALAAIDRGDLAERLGAEKNVVDKALDRVARALGGSDDEPSVPVDGDRVERGVREL